MEKVNNRSQRSSKNLLPLWFINTTTSPFRRVGDVVFVTSSPSSLASALPDRFDGRIGHGNATTTTAPRNVAVNSEDRRDRCDGRYSDLRSGAIVLLIECCNASERRQSNW